MDPQATWQELLSCLSNEQFADAHDHANALDQWLAKGGFTPQTIPLVAPGDELHRVIAQAVVQHVLASDE
jgi:hypothetical protein